MSAGWRRWLSRPLDSRLRALADGLRALREGDYGISLATGDGRDAMAELMREYNTLADTLRRERLNQHQHELMLDSVMQAAPQALLLVNVEQRVVYANASARQLFGAGPPLEGFVFSELLATAPTELREAALAGREGLVSIGQFGETEIYQVSHSAFAINAQPHRLHQFQRLTRELNRQEIATWKRVIKVISHELNNSLAPISSLAHSSRLLAAQGPSERLDGALATIGERAQRLKQFLEGYSRFARLSRPQPECVEWAPFLEQIQRAVVFSLTRPPPPTPAWFDRAQFEQALINLLKNAQESGSAPEAVELDIAEDGDQLRLRVLDRGSGLNSAVLANALLPFYTTKPEGNGLGLALCREIVEAHGGRLALGNRADGRGAEVRMWLPLRTA